jgi:hypothetical protein
MLIGRAAPEGCIVPASSCFDYIQTAGQTSGSQATWRLEVPPVALSPLDV